MNGLHLIEHIVMLLQSEDIPPKDSAIIIRLRSMTQDELLKLVTTWGTYDSRQ